jgi:methionine synthase II (cobalamin-independent)
VHILRPSGAAAAAAAALSYHICENVMQNYEQNIDYYDFAAFALEQSAVVVIFFIIFFCFRTKYSKSRSSICSSKTPISSLSFIIMPFLSVLCFILL